MCVKNSLDVNIHEFSAPHPTYDTFKEVTYIRMIVHMPCGSTYGQAYYEDPKARLTTIQTAVAHCLREVNFYLWLANRGLTEVGTERAPTFKMFLEDVDHGQN